jgi:hypothetical protein
MTQSSSAPPAAAVPPLEARLANRLPFGLLDPEDSCSRGSVSLVAARAARDARVVGRVILLDVSWMSLG